MENKTEGEKIIKQKNRQRDGWLDGCMEGRRGKEREREKEAKTEKNRIEKIHTTDEQASIYKKK